MKLKHKKAQCFIKAKLFGINQKQKGIVLTCLFYCQSPIINELNSVNRTMRRTRATLLNTCTIMALFCHLD